MNNNKNLDRHMNGNLNVNLPKCEINTAHAEFCIEEFSYKGITLKGFRAHANASFTDEKVRVETDACMKLFGQLLGEFAPSIIKLIEAETENTTVRKAWYEAQTKEAEARTKKYEAEAKAAEHKCNCKKENKDAEL